MAQSDSRLPLHGINVLDLTVARAGPAAVRLLSDWGANVIRLEPPPPKDHGSVTGQRRGSDEQNLHRNKRSMCVDLKAPEGAQILARLLENTDVVVENFRSVVKARLGLTYEALSARNPRVILASISGFGQDGPYSERPGVDQIVQGMCGLSSVTGEPGRGPVRVGIAISDTTAGMFLGQGILLALFHRERTGRGQWVHTSLIESMLNKLDFQAARYTVDGEVPTQQGNAHPTLVPMGTYRASDGLVNIAASTQRMWANFCQALEAHDLLDHADYRDARSRARNRVRLDEAIQAHTSRFTCAELMARLNPAGVPCGPVLDIGQAFEDPQVRHLGMTRSVRHPVLGELDLLRSPINLSAAPHPERFARAAPDPGEQTDELLAELGYAPELIAQWRDKGAIA
ncbi:CaiB/BaiF CoA transferase family protein [Cupriavidus gilardii]|uniref:CaiB/BaiF CoA transferase family protein n=1 Tax=Cupriavidus gilardii TaxID=82541 RepID=UPI0021C04C48|nr:CoA transferase [Cupriavidus gilardii]MCT9124837.1 CoA transferase [Cupriavidus gilardii]